MNIFTVNNTPESWEFLRNLGLHQTTDERYLAHWIQVDLHKRNFYPYNYLHEYPLLDLDTIAALSLLPDKKTRSFYMLSLSKIYRFNSYIPEHVRVEFYSSGGVHADS